MILHAVWRMMGKDGPVFYNLLIEWLRGENMKKCVVYAMLTVLLSWNCSAMAEPVNEIPRRERCKVCGMFVAKYRPWAAQISTASGKTLFFDGVKDMMAYYHAPADFGGENSFGDIYVTDYYTQRWIDGRKAFYVTGSDVLGPMGHEFIPFDAQDAAENFKRDHRGKAVVRFADISHEMVNRMRMGGHSMQPTK